MKLKSVLLKGEIENCLKISISSIEPDILSGKWQLAISSIGISFNSEIKSTLLTVSTNFIIGRSLNNSGQLILSPSVLHLFSCAGNQGEKKTFCPKSKDFFEVTNASSVLEFYLKNVENDSYISGAQCYILIVMRRIN